MREWWNKIKAAARRLRQRLRYTDGRAGWLAGRWLALGLLVVAVAAVTLWNDGLTEQGGLQQGLLEAAAPGDLSLQEDTAPAAPVLGDNLTDGLAAKNDAPQTEAPQTADNINNADDADDAVEDGDVYDHAPEPWAADAELQAEAALLSLQMPLAGEEIRGYGYGYDATFGDYRFHGGVDLQGAAGDKVQAALSGEVAALPEDPVRGQGVLLQHGEKLQTVYLGVQPAAGLAVGQKVEQGQEIGRLTQPGVFESAEPPHLHLEILLEGEAVDPADYAFVK